MKNVFFIGWIFIIASCGQSASSSSGEKGDTANKKPVVINAGNQIPMYRDTVRAQPVAQYVEKIDNPLNDWSFAVKLYETKKTFHYLIKLQYEEIRGEDTLKLPNFGLMPNPSIQKGPEKYSCIIGFTDMEGKFREYKKIYVKGNHLKITALKHYGVAMYEEERSSK